jgi:hypothetical protein
MVKPDYFYFSSRNIKAFTCFASARIYYPEILSENKIRGTTYLWK